jgi:hypothetical protein
VEALNSQSFDQEFHALLTRAIATQSTLLQFSATSAFPRCYNKAIYLVLDRYAHFLVILIYISLGVHCYLKLVILSCFAHACGMPMP